MSGAAAVASPQQRHVLRLIMWHVRRSWMRRAAGRRRGVLRRQDTGTFLPLQYQLFAGTVKYGQLATTFAIKQAHDWSTPLSVFTGDQLDPFFSGVESLLYTARATRTTRPAAWGPGPGLDPDHAGSASGNRPPGRRCPE